ncbi:SKA3 protein, partial [Lophotis ruficrista]|nr:SKA3 protein [Lophotis ruficrista]
MEVSRDFFGKLRALALTLEKEAKQLERALLREDTDYEEESPIRVLHDLHCEIRTLKEDVISSLGKSCAEKQAVHDFMKASEILMQRNATDLGKIRELFRKYGYKPLEEVNSESAVSVQNKSDEEKADDVPHLPGCTEKPLVPKDPLRNPQLSDYGLSQYAFSRPWSAVKGQHATNAYQENSKNRTPLKTQTSCILPKTPKCMLKMDDYECVTPRLEHFGISEHTMCMNEDYTMSLIRKTAQTSKNGILKETHCFAAKYLVFREIVQKARTTKISSGNNNSGLGWFFLIPDIHRCEILQNHANLSVSVPQRFLLFFRLVKDDHEVNVPEGASREIMVTPGPKVIVENAPDWMASPMMLVFCTPDVKIPSRTNSMVLSRSLEKNKPPLQSCAGTPRFPAFETRWLKPEAKVVNSNYVNFHTSYHKKFFQMSQGEKVESVTKNDATDKKYREDSIPFATSSDEYLKHLRDPSPPKIKHYDELLSTPPPPEITRIPDYVRQMLSKYNKVDSSKAKEIETKPGNITRYESDFTGSCNKENRYYLNFTNVV